MQITVVHSNKEVNEAKIVATVEYEGTDVDRALEYAFRWTQNLDGSWSQGERIESWQDKGFMEDNMDFNPNVTVVAPLPTHCGRTYGHRSSSVGDIFVIDGHFYAVASFGFEKVHI
jgi:hypothetical protein